MSLDLWQGAEQEYASGSRPVELFEALGRKGVYVFKPDDGVPRAFLRNGGLCYVHSSLFEACTPECRNPLELVAYDKACEAYARLASWAHEEETGQLIHLYKTNIAADPKGEQRYTTVGSHENYLVERSSYLKGQSILVPYLILRQVFCGAGGLVDGVYMMSPRAIFPKKVYSEVSTDYPIVSTRDDPHADPEKYWRLHDINWEGLRSPYQVYLRDCLETLVMTAYEKGYYVSPPRLADPVAAMKELTVDTEECNWKVRLEGGGHGDALADILEGFYLAGIEEMMDEEAPNEADRAAFNLIQATVDGLGERRLEYFIDGLDWVTKKALIEEYSGALEEGVGICNQYTLLDGEALKYLGEASNDTQTTFSLEDSLTFARDAAPWEDWDSLPEKISRATMRGPEGTREYIRCLVAREFPGMLNSVEWERINFHNATVHLDEPFIFNKQMCGDALEEAAGTFMEFTAALDKLNRMGGHLVFKPVDDHERRDREV